MALLEIGKMVFTGKAVELEEILINSLNFFNKGLLFEMTSSKVKIERAGKGKLLHSQSSHVIFSFLDMHTELLFGFVISFNKGILLIIERLQL